MPVATMECAHILLGSGIGMASMLDFRCVIFLFVFGCCGVFESGKLLSVVDELGLDAVFAK